MQKEALKIQSQLAQRNPELYLPDVAMTLSDLGSLDLQQSKLDDARQHYEEAFEVLSSTGTGTPRKICARRE